MNHVALIGRLTADPEIRATQDGKRIARYTLAVDRKEGADFIPCISFGAGADFAEKYLKKGTKIAVEGRLHSDKYTDKAGNNRTSYTVVVWQFHFCEAKRQEQKTETENAMFSAVPDYTGLPWG